MTAEPLGDLLDLTIERVAHGGVCVARADDRPDGRVVFVRHALPGERVRAAVTEDHGRYLRADAVQVLVASPDRVAPPCPFAGPGRCGGCDWQHATLSAQLSLKAAVVREQFARLAHLDVDVEVEPLPDPETSTGPGLGWRTRMEFGVRPDGVLGLHRHRSHDLEAVDDCLIAHPLVGTPRLAARRWRGAGRVEVAVSERSRERMVTVVPRRHGRPRRDRPTVTESAIGRTWRVSAAGFWQVHPAAADVVVSAVLDALDPNPGASVLDLYAGVGLFAGAFAQRVTPTGRVVAVEGDATAAKDAAHNLRDLAEVVTVETSRVDVALTRRASETVDLVVLDPPRAGAGADVIRAIIALRPQRVAYVSCDPATLARDVATAVENGYRLAALRAFDLFPMTAHVECLAVLEPMGTS